MNKHEQNPHLAEFEVLEIKRSLSEDDRLAGNTAVTEEYVADIQNDVIEKRSLMTKNQINRIDSSNMRHHLKCLEFAQREISEGNLMQVQVNMLFYWLGVQRVEEITQQIETLNKYLGRES